MAAKTPDTLKRVGLGSAMLNIATFSTANIDNGDTWATGMPSVIDAWADIKSAPTVSGSNIACVVSGSTITFSTDKDNLTGTIKVLTGLQV